MRRLTGRREARHRSSQMDERRAMILSGYHNAYEAYTSQSCESQLTARSLTHVRTRDVTLAWRCRRDVTDGALGSCSEAQGARATSSRGYLGSTPFVYIPAVPVEP